MNLNQLRYFVSVADTGSFTKAAMLQYISQTAITQQIRALEENVGAKLFAARHPNSRPVSLTPEERCFSRRPGRFSGVWTWR